MLRMNRRTATILAIAVFGLSAFIVLVPAVPITPACPSYTKSCHPPTEFVSLSFNFLYVGGFYLPPCGYYLVNGRGSWTLVCPINTTPTPTPAPTNTTVKTLKGENFGITTISP